MTEEELYQLLRAEGNKELARTDGYYPWAALLRGISSVLLKHFEQKKEVK